MLAESSSGADAPAPPAPVLATAMQPNSPCFSSVATKNLASTNRSIAIVIDLSDDSNSAPALRWAVQYYLRPGDAVVLLQVRPTSLPYRGADWGSISVSVSGEAGGGSFEEELQKKREEDYVAFISAKAKDLVQPLVDAQIPFNIALIWDHACLEAERRGLSAMIVARRTFGASGKGFIKGSLGGISDYCVKHCVCPIVYAPYPDDAADDGGDATGAMDELQDEHAYEDAPEVQKDGAYLTSSFVKPMEKLADNNFYPSSVFYNCGTPSCFCQHLPSPSQQLSAMAGQAASPVNYSADKISRAFDGKYYHTLREQPDQLHYFYQDSSFVGQPEPNKTMVNVTTLSGGRSAHAVSGLHRPPSLHHLPLTGCHRPPLTWPSPAAGCCNPPIPSQTPIRSSRCQCCPTCSGTGCAGRLVQVEEQDPGIN